MNQPIKPVKPMRVSRRTVFYQDYPDRMTFQEVLDDISVHLNKPHQILSLDSITISPNEGVFSISMEENQENLDYDKQMKEYEEKIKREEVKKKEIPELRRRLAELEEG